MVNNKQKVGAVIVAAGSSQRMAGVDKVFALLGGKPVLARAVAVFQEYRDIDQIVVVLNEQNLERGRQLVAEQGWSRVSDVCPGGRWRQDSVVAGLSRLSNCDCFSSRMPIRTLPPSRGGIGKRLKRQRMCFLYGIE